MTENQKICCEICKQKVHSIQLHLQKEHPEMSLEEYKRRFPEAPLYSDYAKSLLEKHFKEKTEAARQDGVHFFHEVFNLTSSSAFSTEGSRPIPITVLNRGDGSDLIPEVNTNYVFNIKELKFLLSGIEMGMPVYIWGHKGAGKTELVEQICARTQRPLLRVQHTVNTEEAQIIGQWVVRDGETKFEYGPLPMAMLNGWAYLADEYDFALPNVLAVYQAVLEGKPLMIKEAPASMRIVKPHPNFRFFATGNTNGTGDETGLYQGTTIQNSANYDRFGVVLKKAYMGFEDELKILTGNSEIQETEARELLQFAKSVREAFDAGKISDTISPRTLLFAAKLGIVHASFRTGLRLAFMNKLSAADYEVCDAFAQRLYGGGVDDE
ncbi:AAA family ATPase [Sutterella wadsworthensis]|uniref:AAA family ATPase n=1 Tax=Sutterella wadsworthensis TaxID=40545 RepID=UPI00241FF3D6|nr:AAA family ATPase [Sutterella wadsworthensis]